MRKDNVAAASGISPDLFVPPHILPLLMELFAGDKQQAVSHQEQLVAHLLTCHYCRTAVIVLLGVVQEYDRRNNDAQEPARDLLVNMARISREIEAGEARADERLGAYADTFVHEGQEEAERCFPDVAAHLKICPDCSALVEMTVDSINALENGMEEP
jgi:hypothetical protein